MKNDIRYRRVSILLAISVVTGILAMFVENMVIFYILFFIGGWCGLIGGYSFIFITYDKQIQKLFRDLGMIDDDIDRS